MTDHTKEFEEELKSVKSVVDSLVDHDRINNQLPEDDRVSLSGLIITLQAKIVTLNNKYETMKGIL